MDCILRKSPGYLTLLCFLPLCHCRTPHPCVFQVLFFLISILKLHWVELSQIGYVGKHVQILLGQTFFFSFETCSIQSFLTVYNSTWYEFLVLLKMLKYLRILYWKSFWTNACFLTYSRLKPYAVLHLKYVSQTAQVQVICFNNSWGLALTLSFQSPSNTADTYLISLIK